MPRHKLIVIGQKSNTCIDSTVRYAAELGYDVTLVKVGRKNACGTPPLGDFLKWLRK